MNRRGGYMKQIKIFLIISLTFVLPLTACSSFNFQKSTETALKNNSQFSKEQDSEKQKQGRIQDRADLYGRVKTIIGNEVVLELMEMPKANEQEKSETDREGNTSTGQFPPGQGSGFRQRSGGQREVNLTGETMTFFIPVGVPINSFGINESKELDIADIYQGNILQVWYDNDTDKNIIQVMVMQGR